MTPRPAKRPVNLTAAIVVLWFQAVANLGVGFVLIAVGTSEQGPTAGLTSAAGLISVLAAPVLVAGAVGLTRRKVWARVPVIVVEGLIILSGLVMVVQALLAGAPPTGFVGILLAVLVLQGCLAKETTAWLTGTAPRVAP